MNRTNWSKKATILLAAICVLLAALSGSLTPPEEAFLVQVMGVPISRETYSFLLSEALMNAQRNADGSPKDVKALRKVVMAQCTALVAVNSELYNMERSLDQRLKFTVSQQAAFHWQVYHGFYETIGVDKPTVTAMLLHKANRDQLFSALYDTNGSRAVPEETVESYFYGNYVAYNGVRVFTSVIGEDGKEREMTADEKDALRVTLGELAQRVNDGADFFETVGEERYAKVLSYASPMRTVVQRGTEDITEAQFEKIRELSPEKVSLLEFSSYFLLAQGLNMRETPEEHYQYYRSGCLLALKSEEFQQILAELYAAFPADENTAAVDRLLEDWPWEALG